MINETAMKEALKKQAPDFKEAEEINFGGITESVSPFSSGSWRNLANLQWKWLTSYDVASNKASATT